MYVYVYVCVYVYVYVYAYVFLFFFRSAMRPISSYASAAAPPKYEAKSITGKRAQ